MLFALLIDMKKYLLKLYLIAVILVLLMSMNQVYAFEPFSVTNNDLVIHKVDVVCKDFKGFMKLKPNESRKYEPLNIPCQLQIRGEHSFKQVMPEDTVGIRFNKLYDIRKPMAIIRIINRESDDRALDLQCPERESRLDLPPRKGRIIKLYHDGPCGLHLLGSETKLQFPVESATIVLEGGQLTVTPEAKYKVPTEPKHH